MPITSRRRTVLSFAWVAVAAAFALGSAPRVRADGPAPAPAPAPAPVPAPAPAPLPAPKPAEPPPSDDLSVSEVLRGLARITGVSITWSGSDKAVNSRTILNAGAVLRTSPDRLFDAVRALLANDEIVLVPYGPAAGRTYRAMDARTLLSQFLVKFQPDVIEVSDETVATLLGQGGRFVTTTLRVRHLTELRDARNALQRLVTQNNVGSIQEVPATRAFIVTDFAPNVASIYLILRQMDVPPLPTPGGEASRPDPAYFVLKHAVAQDVAHLLERLFPPKAAGPTVPMPRPTPEAGAAAPPSAAPRIWYDQATNQVIVIATAEDTAAIREIVSHVDVEAPK